jgi:hypothetical protein
VYVIELDGITVLVKRGSTTESLECGAGVGYFGIRDGCVTGCF